MWRYTWRWRFLLRKVEDIERQIRALTQDEYAELRDWFLEEDAKAWDSQIEADVRAGRLDAFGAEARRARAEGKSTKL